MKLRSLLLFCSAFCYAAAFSQSTSNHGKKFEQLETLLPTPNEYRLADGSPGPKYWQQRCDYDIKVALDDKNQRIDGEERITYHNNSPKALTYLWLQLDENQHDPASDNIVFDQSGINQVMSETAIRNLDRRSELQKNGMKIDQLTDSAGKTLSYTINQTMLRIDLPRPIKPGQRFSFRVKWHYYMVDRIKTPDARGGYEYFPEDGNYLYTVSQWYPRLCVYSDFQGWQNKQFTGRGEFALTFGNFKVQMTVPSDHIVGATGECQNYDKILSPTQLRRWKQAQSSKEPIEIVTLDEAKAAEKQKSAQSKTWIFKAENVRDFAWTTSRRFIWDAMPADVESKKIMCMSYYSKESYPLYRKYSTKLVAHTIKTYSNYTIPYPYPVAQSVEGNAGMEYPMIAFNPGRAQKDGTYSESTRNAMIYVTIHEVGHNFFPMIVNSDERQWSWFDEGINSFVQFLAEKEFDINFPSQMGPATTITDYMKLPKNQLEPIMTNSENIINFGANAYGKPAAALNILRETIMGREQFDYAFKEYARRWAFKHPTPADFFRTMEDASAKDLDWFWRGWFYGIDAVDISIDSMRWYKVNMANLPKKEMTQESRAAKPFEDITRIRNKESNVPQLIDEDTATRDFYTTYEPWNTADSVEKISFTLYNESPDSATKAEKYGSKNFYELYFTNKGGLVMPIILEWTFKDGTKEIERIPAEVWRKNENNVKKVFVKNKEVASVKLDPYRETADIDEANNTWGTPPAQPSRFQVFKAHKSNQLNPMQKEAEKKRGF
ncbi:MAG TPA: M1 family metallopeptidase [Flavisolibacter sp.]|nr:M1 family metallopeptidase [Flavisolibacter sp.]